MRAVVWWNMILNLRRMSSICSVASTTFFACRFLSMHTAS